jgi:CubicO group peptidase (beta-lactamase class C family)
LLPYFLEATGAGGVAVATIKGGKVKDVEFAGVENRTDERPVSWRTVFEVASLSKPVFALTVHQLVQEGKLDLDRPLRSYLGKPYTEEPAADKITARHVLCHKTGWPNWRVESQPLKLDRPPGVQFGYSGEGYVYLATAVAAITGEETETTMRRLVFEPLGLADSSYVWRDDYEGRYATGYDANGDPLRKNRPATPNVAGSLHTTLGDYMEVVIGYLSSSLLTDSTRSTVFAGEATVNSRLSWGLGWGISEGPVSTIWHWGCNSGFNSFITALPVVGSGVVVLTSGEHGQRICAAAVRNSLGLDHPAFYWGNIGM